MKWIACIIAFLFFGHVAKLIWDAGAFKTLSPHGFEHCKRSDLIPGAEDFAWDSEKKWLFISSDDRSHTPSESLHGGSMWLLDLNSYGPAVKLMSEYPKEFHPHGISSFRSSEGVFLGVINHRILETTIELFLYKDSTLQWIKTMESALFSNANDLVLLDSEKLVLTRDHLFENPRLKQLEDYSRWGQGSLVYYDGHEAFTIYRNINYANGIALSNDRHHLAVASMLDRKILIFSWQTDHPQDLRFSHSLSLGTSPDNLMFDENQNLWVGAHPQLFKLKAHSEDPKKPAPSQVLKVSDLFDSSPKTEEVFLNLGDLISAVSVAFSYHNQWVLGSIFDSYIVRCQ